MRGRALWGPVGIPREGGRAGAAYSVCWLESFTAVLGFGRVWVPVKAK